MKPSIATERQVAGTDWTGGMLNSRGLVVFVLVASACAQSPGRTPEGGTLPPIASWRVLPAAAIEWPCAANSRVEWTVLKTNGGVQAVPGLEVSDRLPFFLWPKEIDGAQHFAGAAHVQAVQDGYLIGFDAGEFGGAAWWFSRDGRHRKRLTVPPPTGADYSSENVHGFVPFGTDYLAFQGLAHMGIDEGRVIRVARTPTGGWTATLFATLPDSPDAALAETENSWLFVSNSGIWRIDAEARLSTVWRPEKGSLSYPSSMARGPNGEVYVGMRHFIARLSPSDANPYQVDLLVPPSCDNTSCDCGDDVPRGSTRTIWR